MIESCPKRRMLLGITLLGILTILIIIVESHWTDRTNPSRKRVFPVEQNSTCWKNEKYEIVKDCQPCTAFEIRSKSIGVCVHTHYKEVLKCSSGEIVTRSCDRTAHDQERTFYRFELCAFVTAVFSSFCVVSRKAVLNKRLLQRVQRQLANSV